MLTGLETDMGCFAWLRNEKRPLAGASFFLEKPENPAKAFGLS